MRYLAYVLLAILSVVTLTSCENKWDENGDFDGLWRYDSIVYHTPMGDSVEHLAGRQRYMAIQLALASFRDNDLAIVNGYTNETQSRFEWRGDSLIFAPMYIHFRATDSLLTQPQTMANARFGIRGHEGHFKVEVYNAKRLVLNSDYARIYLVKF